MQKPRYKLSALFGILVLAVVVAVISWFAFGGFTACGAGCNPVSIFRFR
jgi:hypothetical protein